MADTEADPQAAALFLKLKGWVKHALEAHSDWYAEADEAYAFVGGRGAEKDRSGGQWTQEDYDAMISSGRQPIEFNRIGPVIDLMCGLEVNNRQEVIYRPRTEGDTEKDERLSSLGKWARDEAQAEDEESEMHRDAAICGRGFTDTYIDFDEEVTGKIIVENFDPREGFVDPANTKANFVRSRYRGRFRDIPLDEAQGMFPDVSASALDATWAGRIDLKDGGEGNKRDYPEETRSALKDNKPPKSVRVVQIQWWDHDDVFMVAMPGEDQPREIPAEDWAQLQPEAEAQGITAQRVKKRRYYQAFLGKSSILDQAEKPCFSIHAQTGKLDRKRGYHYGWVRAMRDPQRLANKTLSNVNHIMTTNAKGGIMYEEGAFANPRDAEADWSNPSKSIKLKQGGIERIKDRTPPPMPPALVQLWDAAVSSFRDVTGINIEVMGLADREQAASLEYQRRQSAMTILAALFGSKRRYHKMHGETLLETLKLLPPGVLVRVLIDPKVAQAEYAQAMQQWQQAAMMAQQQGQQPPPQPEPPTAEFMKSTYRGEVFDPSAFGLDDDARFDVIVDETPFSPNQKEATWAALAPFMDRLPPAAVKKALKYSPLPETAAVEIGDAIEQGAGGGEIPPELQQAIEAGKEQISKLTEENQQLRQDQENKVAKLSIDKQDADTRRIKAEGDLSLETMQQRIDALHATVDRLLAAHQATKQDEGSANGY